MSSALWCVLNGRAAAPPAMACSVGPFDLDEALAGQRVADRLHDLRALQEPRQHALGVDQVEVAHPLPQLGIGQAVVLFGRRLDRLGEEVQLLGEDRQLAGLGALQLAVDADQVAQVEALGQGPVLLAHLAAADEHLDLAGPVADVDEDQLARLRCSTIRPAARTFGPCCVGSRWSEPGGIGSTVISPSRARISPMGIWSSKRPPQGSMPSPGSCAVSRAARPRACRGGVHGGRELIERCAWRWRSGWSRLIVVLHFARKNRNILVQWSCGQCQLSRRRVRRRRIHEFTFPRRKQRWLATSGDADETSGCRTCPGF